MKTTVPAKLMMILVLLANQAISQGLVFKNPLLQTANSTDLKVGAIYLFKSVKTGVNAYVSIDSTIGGATVRKIDDNSGGLGYLNAFQPELGIPSGSGTSYVVFTIRFVDSATGVPKILNSVQATALDIDGNVNLKEFVDVNMGGGQATFNSILDISVLQILSQRFRGLNLLGIERDGIDTSATGNMFTVTKANINSYSIKAGAVTIAGGSTQRQFSFYMKGFTYENVVTLPVKMESFTAMFNGETKADLKWVTSSETNVSHFVVEKSTDGRNYTDAGVVFAYGSATTKATYTFTDNLGSSRPTVVYYRLRSVDNDSKSQLSEVRVIRSSKSNEVLALMTYPNPVVDELRVTVPAAWQGKPVVIEMFSQTGLKMKSARFATVSQTETVMVSDLSKGFYLVKASCGSETAQQKLIKQ